LPGDRRYHHPDFDKKGLQGWRAVHREAALPQTAWIAASYFPASRTFST
jgi:hypothetical protein